MLLTLIRRSRESVLNHVNKFESILGKDAVKTASAVRDQYSHDECHHE